MASLRFQEVMPLSKRRDFDTLTEAVVAFHGINPNHYRVQWRDLAMTAMERHQQLDQRLGIIFTQWAKEVLATPELLIEHDSLEKLLSLMTDKIQTWERSQKPTTRRAAARMADDFILNQPKNARRPYSGARPDSGVRPDSYNYKSYQNKPRYEKPDERSEDKPTSTKPEKQNDRRIHDKEKGP